MRPNVGFRPRLPDSLPGWLALPLVVPWAVLAVFFWICAGVWIVARFTTQQVQRAWRAWEARRGA
jgi:hypothetical protein